MIDTAIRASKSSPRLLLAGVVVCFAACATQPQQSPPPDLPNPGADGEYEVSLPEPPPTEAREIQVSLGADLARCDVNEPHFFYDASEPRPQAIPELERLAECLSDEPFAHVNILLVGRADQRGSEAYNLELGRQRAEVVKQKLVEGGVAPERIKTESRGEAESIGDQPIASHGYDRRVDIVQLSVIAP